MGTFDVKCAALLRKWFPSPPERHVVERRLQAFYASHNAYFDMIAEESKAQDPQVKLLEALIQSGGVYADVGCGTGIVAERLSATARIVGFDISPLAIQKAQARCRGRNTHFAVASAEHLPLPDGLCDGAYALELLEHVWEPVAVLREMVRIIRPGGFLFLSAPVGFSLDLHLRKRGLVRLIEMGLAAARFGIDRIAGHVAVHVEPRLDGTAFPDCDLISALIPSAVAQALERDMGCAVDFWDTTYLRAHREGAGTDLAFQRRTAHPFFRHFGDHWILLAHRQESLPPHAEPRVP